MIQHERHLLGIRYLAKDRILKLIDSAGHFCEVSDRVVKKVPSLRGKTIVNLFLEPSTRTRTSFEIAAKRLSADAVNIAASTSSSTKGETLLDTAYTLQAMSPDAIVIRDSHSGSAHLLAKYLSNTPIINAGDGLNEHPTQALLDALSIVQRLGRIDNLTIALVGDVLRGRVARSNLFLHKILGNKIRVVAPPTIARKEFASLGAEVFHSLEDGIRGADVVMTLRMKFEYLKDTFVPNIDEYSRLYCLNETVLRENAPNAIVMAPGPITRGVELTSEVADGPRSLIATQVANGVAVRMAVLFELASSTGQKEETV